MNKKQRPKKSASSAFVEQLKQLAASSELDPEGSLSSTRPLLKSHPDHVLLLTIAGNAARAAKLLDEALVYTDRALAIEPNNLWALRVRAKIEIDQDRHQEALSFLVHANSIYPDDVQVLELLAATLLALDQYDEFRACYQRLTEKAGPNSVLLNNYGHMLLKTADIEGALRVMQESIELDPNNQFARANRIFALHYSTRHTPEDILRECRNFQDYFRIPHRVNRAQASNLQADKKIRIGMISDGFRAHPVGSMITYGLAHVPREQIEFYAYSTNDSSDHITEKIKNLCAKWDHVEKLSADELDQLIRRDKIDILLDLAGFNKNFRIQTIMMEPAPIIVKWVGGLISSTGLDAIDYLISDRIETPVDTDHLYTEKLIRLPDDYICFQPHFYTPSVDELPASRNNYVTFGCFNNISKINEKLLGAWAGILNSVPNSHLFLKTHGLSNKTLCQRIWSFFSGRSIDQKRIRLEGASPHNELLKAYNDVDIALDPWPYSGGLTTCEALIMGVPVITLPGPTFAGRHSATHLVNAGMPELVAHDWEQYQKLAIGLANDLDNLSIIRENLRAIVLQSPLCDEKRFGQSFSNAMRAIWQRYCAEKKPEALALGNDLAPYFADEEGPVMLTHPTSIHEVEKKPLHQDGAFRFKLTGRVVVVDHGTNLAANPHFIHWKAKDAFSFLLFDPAGIIEKQKLPLDLDESIQCLPFHTLSSSPQKKTTLFVGPDPSKSSTFPSLDKPEKETEKIEKITATVEIPIFTVKSDELPGVSRIDWLLLCGRYELLSLFSSEEFLGRDALIIQANIPTQQSYRDQPTLDAVINRMKSLGFDLYRINSTCHRDYWTGLNNADCSIPATYATEYTLLFIPEKAKLEKLDINAQERLAFILHTAYQIYDLAYRTLTLHDTNRAQLYMQGILQKTKKNKNSPQKQLIPATSTARPPSSVKKVLSIAIPDTPAMSLSEINLLKKYLKKCQNYFEFGSGGSSKLASKMGVLVHGVESDPVWLQQLQKEIGENKIKHVDIGPTREWGYPVDLSAQDRFPLYSQSIHQTGERYDFILVDGRFRVACALQSARHIIQNDLQDNSIIFVHDFWGRDYYKPMLYFLDEVESIDTAIILKVKPDVDLKKLDEQISRYSTDFR